jgi:hypothetical protein
MGFIVALMLTYMDEESAFWMVNSLMTKYEMKGYFTKNFPALQKSFYVLLRLIKKYIPKIYEHFKAKEVHPSMYASQWFITLFAVNFRFDILVRIFDVFLLEGQKILYRIALAVLKIKEDKILNKKGFDEVMVFMKNLFESITADDLFARAFKFSISRDHIAVKFYLNYLLKEFEAQYESAQIDKEDEYMKQIKFI